MKSLKEIKEVSVQKHTLHNSYYWFIVNAKQYGLWSGIGAKDFKTQKSVIGNFREFCKVNGIPFEKIKIKG